MQRMGFDPRKSMQGSRRVGQGERIGEVETELVRVSVFEWEGCVQGLGGTWGLHNNGGDASKQ